MDTSADELHHQSQIDIMFQHLLLWKRQERFTRIPHADGWENAAVLPFAEMLHVIINLNSL